MQKENEAITERNEVNSLFGELDICYRGVVFSHSRKLEYDINILIGTLDWEKRYIPFILSMG